MLQQTWGFGQGPPKKLIPVDYQITISVGLPMGTFKETLGFCKPARQTTESIQIYKNIPGSKLPRFSCQITHVGAKDIQTYCQTNPDTNMMNLIQRLFSEFIKLEKESRSKRHQQNITTHYPNISFKPVKQCQDNKT